LERLLILIRFALLGAFHLKELNNSSVREKRILSIATAFVIISGALALIATAFIIITVVPDKGQREETLPAP
jgi:hypothetical protein